VAVTVAPAAAPPAGQALGGDDRQQPAGDGAEAGAARRDAVGPAQPERVQI
jgi:hypothetical protein